LFWARGVNAEKKYKNEEAIQSDATARQPDCWQVRAMILNTIILLRVGSFSLLQKRMGNHPCSAVASNSHRLYFPIQTFTVS